MATRPELQDVMLRVLEILAGDGDLAGQLGRIHQELWRVTCASNLYVALYDEPSGLYVFPYNADPDDQDFAPQLLRKSLTDYVRRRGEAMLVRQRQMAELVAAGEIEPVGIPSPVWLGAPLTTPTGAIGAVVVQHYTDAEAITDDDLPVLAAIGRCMGVAVARSWQDTRRRAEHELRVKALQSSRDEALRANEAKSTFLATMSHELRTPLNAILGYTDLWLEDDDGEDPALRRDLGAIRSAAQHLRSLIDGVLDLTQVESGACDAVPSTFLLPGLLDEVWQQATPLASRRGNLLLRTDDPAIGELLTDRRLVLQVVLNLVANACKFTEHGTVAVRSRGVGDDVELVVSDTGPGIDPDRLEDVFRPFVQLGDDRSGSGGSGLGLAIASRYARVVGGDLRAASVPGQGSTFTFTFPGRPRTR